MDKIFVWIGENKEKTIFIIIFLTVVLTAGIPIGIHILYNITAPVPYLEAPWNAGNALEYYGATLSFIGTIVFSGLAVYQTHVIKEESNAREDAMRKLEEFRQNPVLRGKIAGSSGNNSNLQIIISNDSENVAHDLIISNFEVRDKNQKVILKSTNVEVKSEVLKPISDLYLDFSNDSIMGNDLIISFGFSCTNQLGKRLNYEVLSYCKDSKELVSKKTKVIVRLVE